MNCRQLPNGDMAKKEREEWTEEGGGGGEIWKEDSQYGERRESEGRTTRRKGWWNSVKRGDIITFTPSLKPSTSHLQWQGTDQRTQREWRTATCPAWKGLKKDMRHIFVCQQVTPAHPAWRARFRSRSYEKCQECFHLPPFYSPLPLSISFGPVSLCGWW